MNITFIDDNYENSIDKLKKFSKDLIKIHKYHFKDNINNYFICILNENFGNSHVCKIDKIIINKLLDNYEEIKMICAPWIY